MSDTTTTTLTDGERTARRMKWEEEVGPDAVAAARAARLSMLRLKHRLGNLVINAKNVKEDGLRIKRLERNLKRGQKVMHRRVMLQMPGMQAAKEKIRKETRIVQIAHGFMRGTSYAEMEQICWTKPDWLMIQDMVAKHSGAAQQDVWQRYEQWYQAAKLHLETSFKGVEPTRAEIMDKLRNKRAKLDAAMQELGIP